MRKAFLIFISLLSCTYFSIAQNSSPYWSLAGNSNATTSSKLGTTNAIPLRLYTKNSERMRLDTLGRVGIGTTNPTERLHVNSASGTNALRVQVGGSTKLLLHYNGGLSIGNGSQPPSNGLYVSGNVGIGTTTPSYKLQVNGNASIATGLIVSNGGISSTNTSSTGNGVYASGYYGIYGSGSNTGVYGTNLSTTSGYGLYGSAYIGVYATSSASSGDATRSYAYGTTCYGVNAYSSQSIGVYASTGNASSYAGYFSGNVFTTGAYLPSDRRLKQNVEDVGDALNVIGKLQTKSYEYRQDGNYKLMNLPQGKHFGIIAEDLEQVLPGLIKETEFDTKVAQQPNAAQTESTTQHSEKISFKAVNYDELIPLLVKAVQQQQQQIEDLKQIISKLTQAAGTTNAVISSSTLGQNSPNPVKGSTSIQYTIPSGTNSAQLMITDNLGRTIKSIQLTGSGTVNIDTSTLSSGIYHYSLLIDNKIVQTRKMTVQR